MLAGAGIGGGCDCARIVALGLVAFATACGGWLAGPALRLGSEPRPGGGGGLLAGTAGGCEGETARIVPDGGAGGFDTGPCGLTDGGGEACVFGGSSLPRFGVVGAGFGIPSNVFFISPPWAVLAAA